MIETLDRRESTGEYAFILFHSANRMFQADGMESEWRIWTSKWPYQRLRFFIVLLSLSGQSHPLSKLNAAPLHGKKRSRLQSSYPKSYSMALPDQLDYGRILLIMRSQALKDSRCYPAGSRPIPWLWSSCISFLCWSDSYLDSLFLSPILEHPDSSLFRENGYPMRE